MEPRTLIGSGIAASAIAHLSILTMVFVFAEVNPFGTVTAEPILVDIVSPEQAAPKKHETLPQVSEAPLESPSPKSDPSGLMAAAAAPHVSQVPQVPQIAKQAPMTSRSRKPSNPQQAGAASQPPASSPLLAAIPQPPDIAVKYRVRLGLPDSGPNGGFDTAAFKPADVPVDDTAAFRHHLRKCSTLPDSIAPSDKITIKLRVSLIPDGRLAAAPILIEASASPKGPALMESAIVALQACQPFTMLPADKYDEWKVMDLSFTPEDLAGG